MDATRRGLLDRRAWRAAAGVVAVAIAGAVSVAGIGLADAQEPDQQQPAAINRQAYFTHPATEVVPPVLVNGFPPSTACLVAGLVGVPELCGEAVQDIVDPLGLSDGLPIPITPDSEIVQPVVPGTTPIGMLAGQERYVSLLQFQLPTLPEGQRFGSLELRMRQDGLNFAIESPAFRELVFAAISQVGEQDPELFTDVLQRIADGDTSVVSQAITGIEACPITSGWNGGDAQDAGIDGVHLPDTDCILGTTGSFDAASSTWIFDLTFAAQAWTTGKPGGDRLPNEGILLRPLGAPNVAYGDPDLSTNFLVSLADFEAAEDLRPRLRYTTIPELPERVTLTTGPSTTPAAPSAVAPTGGARPGGVATPAVPAPAPPAAAASFTARWGEQIASTSSPETPAWLLLAVPLALLGLYLFGSALAAEPDAVRRRPGALTRLMARTDGAPATTEGITSR
jgi:hypothetical protein